MDRRYRVKPPRRRDGTISPLALLVLFALVSAPFFAFFWPGDLFRDTSNDYRPPSYAIELDDLSYALTSAKPTIGMVFQATRFGTVGEAPFARAPMVDRREGEGTMDGRVSPDVARFVKAWPRARITDEGQTGVTTLDMPTDYGAGAYTILREGCLHAVSPASAEPLLLVGAWGPSMFRDPEGYLATGRYDGAEEYRLRVGERGGRIALAPVPDERLENVEALRELCGDAPIALLGETKRLPDCSATILATEAERQRHLEAAAREALETNRECKAEYDRLAEAQRRRGGRVTPPPSCYPMPPSPPPEPFARGICRHPDEPVLP